MDLNLAATPFGRRPMTLALVAAQAKAKERAPESSAHKWDVFRAICAARERLGLAERSVAVLDALLSFHPETVLAGKDLVVFPSNEQLALRAHGMAASTLRKHLAVLVDAGVVLRRDSPNGKRFARKGRAGEITHAYGFDLSPLVARAAEFASLAEQVRAEERALRCAKERITLARRDIVKMIASGVEEGVPVGWTDLHNRYRTLVGRLPKSPTLPQLEPIGEELSALAAEILSLLETHVKTKKTSGTESGNERHIQNSKPDSILELEPAMRNDSGAAGTSAGGAVETVFPLGMVLQACPDIADYARGGVTDWRELLDAAEVARAALGVSPSAWEAARAAMGARTAAVVIAAVLQRGSAVASAGGYLRALTRKAEAGEFSVGSMLMALIGARNRERKRA